MIKKLRAAILRSESFDVETQGRRYLTIEKDKFREESLLIWTKDISIKRVRKSLEISKKQLIEIKKQELEYGGTEESIRGKI